MSASWCRSCGRYHWFAGDCQDVSDRQRPCPDLTPHDPHEWYGQALRRACPGRASDGTAGGFGTCGRGHVHDAHAHGEQAETWCYGIVAADRVGEGVAVQ